MNYLETMIVMKNLMIMKWIQLKKVPFEGVLVEAYKGTRRKHNMKFRLIGIQLAIMDTRFFLKLLGHGTGLFH